MKKFVSLVFVFGIFAFIAPCVSAMPVTGINSTVEQNQVKSVIKIPPKRLYEFAVQNNIISIGKREKSHGNTYQIPKRLYEPAFPDSIV